MKTVNGEIVPKGTSQRLLDTTPNDHIRVKIYLATLRARDGIEVVRNMIMAEPYNRSRGLGERVERVTIRN